MSIINKSFFILFLRVQASIIDFYESSYSLWWSGHTLA